MPNIGQVGGATIKVYPNDHPPPHVHVFYQGREVRLRISDAQPLDDVDAFHARVLKDVQDWLLNNRGIAAEVWAKYHD